MNRIYKEKKNVKKKNKSSKNTRKCKEKGYSSLHYAFYDFNEPNLLVVVVVVVFGGVFEIRLFTGALFGNYVLIALVLLGIFFKQTLKQ